MQQKRVLFILKKRQTPVFEPSKGYTCSPGLSNSARFVAKMLEEEGHVSKVVEVVDNNCIDKEVTEFKPTHVIIEAIWVVPEKFKVLQRLHPTVKWSIRVHSELPFIAGEGIAFQWLMQYLENQKVGVSFNSEEMRSTFLKLYTAKYGYVSPSRVIYLPNFYPVNCSDHWKEADYNHIHIGCFGAIRPLKNQLIQAVAAIEYARQHGKVLYYHINSSRIEGKGDSILKNIRQLFEALPSNRYKLIEHEWMDHDKFVAVIQQMQVVYQVSMSETFNIVAADAVNNGIPVVTSKEITWVWPFFWANPTDLNSIIKKTKIALFFKKYLSWFTPNKYRLARYGKKSIQIWNNFLQDQH